MYSNKPPEMYEHIISDEEIDVMNSGDEDEMIRGEPYRHPPEVYMVNDEDELYNDEYGYMEEETFDTTQGMHTAEYIDAHYINTEDDYLPGKRMDEIYLATMSPANVEPRTTAERLAKYPEQRSMPPLRRMKKSLPPRQFANADVFPVHRKLLDPKASAVNHLLVANKVYRGINEVKRKARDEDEEYEPHQIFMKQARFAPGKPIISNPGILERRRRRPPLPFPDPKLPDVPINQMTPLPNRYFRKRITIKADTAGFVSDCLPCGYCNWLFRQRAMLENHVKKHVTTGKKEVTSERSGLICPVQNCTVRSDCIATVFQHLKKSHSVDDLMIERIVFKDMHEFKLWKSELERLTMSKFSRTSGKQNVYSKSTYYQCHHSGNIPMSRDPADTQRKRQTKKLGRTCTAFLHVKENDDRTVVLRGCTKHSGHGKDVRVLPLTDDIKMEIAQHLISGMDENDIVAKMQAETDTSNRRYYLQNYEVRNVLNKIEKYKEDYKRRLLSGEPLPDLADAVSSRADRPVYAPLSARAKLSCSRYPTAAPFAEEYYPEEERHFEEVIEDDGLFNVPRTGEEEDEMLRQSPDVVEVDESAEVAEKPATAPTRTSSRVPIKKKMIDE